jgi:hypothetical protein
MIEGSGSVPLTDGSRSRRPKNIRIIRIRNTACLCAVRLLVLNNISGFAHSTFFIRPASSEFTSRITNKVRLCIHISCPSFDSTPAAMSLSIRPNIFYSLSVKINLNQCFRSRLDPNSVGCVDPNTPQKVGSANRRTSEHFGKSADLRFAKLLADGPPTAG